MLEIAVTFIGSALVIYHTSDLFRAKEARVTAVRRRNETIAIAYQCGRVERDR